MHTFSRVRTLLVAALVWSAGAFTPLTYAQERTRGSGLSNRLDIVQLHHRAFTSSDGAPLRVSDMAQDKAGYLWMTSKNGLYRFDGVRFDQPLPRAFRPRWSRASWPTPMEVFGWVTTTAA